MQLTCQTQRHTHKHSCMCIPEYTFKHVYMSYSHICLHDQTCTHVCSHKTHTYVNRHMQYTHTCHSYSHICTHPSAQGCVYQHLHADRCNTHDTHPNRNTCSHSCTYRCARTSRANRHVHRRVPRTQPGGEVGTAGAHLAVAAKAK